MLRRKVSGEGKQGIGGKCWREKWLKGRDMETLEHAQVYKMRYYISLLQEYFTKSLNSLEPSRTICDELQQ